MTLPTSGPISFQDLNVEMSFSPTAQVSLNDSAIRGLLQVPSGQISMSDAYGKQNALIFGGSVSYFTSGNSVQSVTVPSNARGARIHMWGGGGRNDNGNGGAGGYMNGEGFWPSGFGGGSTLYIICAGSGYRAGGQTAGSRDPDGKGKCQQGWTDTGGGLSGVFTSNPRGGSNETIINSSQILLCAGGGGSRYGQTPGGGGYPNGANGGGGNTGGTQSGVGTSAGNGTYLDNGGLLAGIRRSGNSGTGAGGGGYYPGGGGCNFGGLNNGGAGGSGYIYTGWTLNAYATGGNGSAVGTSDPYWSGSYGGNQQQGQVVIEWGT